MITVLKMSELDNQLLREIDDFWVKSFGYDPVAEDEEVEIEQGWTLVILQDEHSNEVLAVAALSNEYIGFNDSNHCVTGIISMASKYERRGNGKRLLQAIQKHLVLTNTVGVGFCKRSVSPFYEKCGFSVSQNLVAKFREGDGDKLCSHPDGDEDVIFYNDRDKLRLRLEHDLRGVAIVDEFW